MYFQARYKPAGKAAVEAPALTALERYVNVKLQDRYYGEDVAGVRVIFCDSADEARRLGPKYRVAVDAFAPLPAGADPTDLRSLRRAIKHAFARVRNAPDMEIACLRATDRRKEYEAQVIVTPTGNGHELRARLDVTSVRSRTVTSHALGRMDATSSRYLFDSLVFRAVHLELRARSGMRADAARGNVPRVRRFALP